MVLMRDFFPQDPLLGVSVQATTSLPKHPKEGSSRTWRKDKQRSSPCPISHTLRRPENAGVLRNTSRRRYTDSSCSLPTHQGTCMATSSANTFLLARVPKPLHSQFLFSGRACGFFFSFPPPSFLARGQPSPQNRLQDR